MEFVNVKKLYHESLFKISVVEEDLHMVFYGLLAFFIPFFLKHPQLLVGTIVNASLILGAVYLRGHKLLPVIILPSIAVFAAGVIFGPMTMFLLYLIPFIWIGNAIFAYGYRYIQTKTNAFASMIISAFAKALFLFGVAAALVALKVIPSAFLIAMGPLQLATALMGGTLALGIVEVRKRIISRS